MDMKISPNIARVAILTEMTTRMKITVSCGMTPCSLKEMHRRLGETCCLRLHVIRKWLPICMVPHLRRRLTQTAKYYVLIQSI